MFSDANARRAVVSRRYRLLLRGDPLPVHAKRVISELSFLLFRLMVFHLEPGKSVPVSNSLRVKVMMTSRRRTFCNPGSIRTRDVTRALWMYIIVVRVIQWPSFRPGAGRGWPVARLSMLRLANQDFML